MNTSSIKALSDHDLVAYWGAAVDNYHNIYETLESGHLQPSERERWEIGYDNVSERIDQYEEEMILRGLMDANHNLKREYEKYLS